MIESNKKGMFMSAFLIAVAVAGGILMAGVIKSNLMKDTDETDAV
jgi:hypothetical protein|tara:strand:+ start:1420 stop:1554 length:135 start_codon:yes stop_codon:yes gene_type:complete